MVQLELIPGTFIGDDHPCFIVAEIGQNHNGDISTAKQLIQAAKNSGADCIKFQKSDLKEKFTQAALSRIYDSQHSYGITYGDHKRHLELTEDDYRELKTFAEELGIIFSSSGMDKASIRFLNELGVPFLKIGSGDANNFPLIQYAATFGKPMIISSGMQSMETMRTVYQLLSTTTKSFCFLQCTSSYPTQPQDANLNVMQSFRREFPDIPIGYSGHEIGISVSLAAAALGAKVIERHFTLNKSWKGTDHSSSLDPAELHSLVKQIRVIENALGSPIKQFLSCEVPCYNKLGKSIVASRNILAGEILTEEMINIKVSEPKGIKPEEIFKVLGRTVKRDMAEDEPINTKDID